MSLTFPFVWMRQDTDPGGIDIPLADFMWIQSGGFWWAPFSSQQSCQPLDPTGSTDATDLADGATGNSTAFSPRGIVIFPQGEDLTAGVLLPNYTPLGGEGIPTPFSDSLTSGAGQFSVNLTHPPIEGTTYEVYFAGLSSLFYDFYVIGSSLSALAVSNYSFNVSPLTITYDYTVETDPASDSFTGDGSTTTFPLSSIPADALTSATVDGVDDPLAYISENNLILSSAPDVGAAVYCTYTFDTVASGSDTFPVAPGVNVSSFDLSQVPRSGTINVAGFGPNTLGTPAANVQPLVDGQTVRFAIQIPDYTVVSANYQYDKSVGQLFSIPGLTLSEWDLTTESTVQLNIPFPEPFAATNVSNFLNALLAVSSAQGTHWQDGWNHQRWGFLFYDPNTDSYTVVSPIGMHCCTRTGGALDGTYTTQNWPTEEPSTDFSLVGYESTSGFVPGAAIVGLLRRTAPYMGVGVVARYALQGSWGAIGLNMIGVPGSDFPLIAPGDSEFPIRFLRRDALNTWQVVATLNPPDLVAGSTGANPLYIPGTGIIHQEGDGGYATGRRGATPTNSAWPATRDASAWILGCGWCEGEWGRDVSSLYTQANFTESPLGCTDSGYTLSAIDMAGEIASQLTIVCDPTYQEDSYADPSAIVDYQISEASAFTPSFPIVTAYVATAQFGYLNGYGYCYYYYYTTSTDGPAKTPNLQMPGIPALADGEPRYTRQGIDFPQTYGQIQGTEDNAASQSIAGDGADNFYFSLSIPYWVRLFDGLAANSTEIVTGIYDTGPITSGGTEYNEILFRCPGYEGAQLITRVRDQFQNSLDAPYYPQLIGFNPPTNYCECFPQSGYSTRFQLTFDYQVAFVETVVDNTTSPPTYVPQSFDNLSVPWAEIIPNRGSATLRRTYDYPNQDGASFYALPGNTDFAPFQGAAVYDVVGDNRRSYDVSARTFLFKVNCSAGILSEVWRQDISQQGKVFPDTSAGPTSEPSLAISQFAKVFFTRPCGRYIFLLRSLLTNAQTGEAAPNNVAQVEYLGLEVWTNPSTGSPEKKFTLYLPDLPDPFNYAGYHGLPQDLQMHQGLDSSSQEWALVIGNRSDGPQRFKIQFNTDPDVAPVVTYDNSLYTNYSPTQFNAQGMAEGNSTYVWTQDDGTLNTRDGV